MPRYLQKRRRRWYAVLEIPKNLQPKFEGKRRLFKSLETESLTVAESRVLSVVAKWKQGFDALNSGYTANDAVAAIENEVAALEAKGWDYPEIYLQTQSVADATEDHELMEAVQVVFGGIIRTERQIESYIETLSATAKTKDMQRADLQRFAKTFPYADEVKQSDVMEWVEGDLMNKNGLSVPTCRRIISACRGYWRYMEKHHKLKTPTPFENVVPAQRRSSHGHPKSKRKAFSRSDYEKLIKASESGPQALSDLIVLAAYTGARIEELCSLKIEKVTEDRIEIEDAKTAAGWRVVPIHSHIATLVKSLKTDSKDGYLISGLSFNKYRDRSNAIGKRFGRLKTKLGYGPDYVFHSFRKGFATQLESAKVPENIAARLLGHEFKTMSYGVYSGGVDYEVLKEALSHINWS